MKLININKVSSVIVLQDEIEKEDKNMTTDTITMSNGRIQHKRKAAVKLILWLCLTDSCPQLTFNAHFGCS